VNLDDLVGEILVGFGDVAFALLAGEADRESLVAPVSPAALGGVEAIVVAA